MNYGNSSWLIFLTIYSPISFSVSSLSHIFLVHLYPDVPWMCTYRLRNTRAEIVEVRLSQRPIFALAYWKLIALEIIVKNSTWVVYNFWEWESEKEQGQMGSVWLRVCGFLSPDQRLYKGYAPQKSEDGSSSEIITRSKITPSRCYKFIKQQIEICPALCWPELQD